MKKLKLSAPLILAVLAIAVAIPMTFGIAPKPWPCPPLRWWCRPFLLNLPLFVSLRRTTSTVVRVKMSTWKKSTSRCRLT